MKPANRFLLSGVVLVAVLGVASAAGMLWQTRRAAAASALGRLQVAGTVESELQANRLRELQLRAEVLASDTAFVDYVAQSLIPNPQLGGAVDAASISDLLTERRRGYDIAAVLDPQGRLIATSGILLRDPVAILHDPLVLKAIHSQTPVQGTWVDHGELLWVAVNPLLRGGALQGVLLTATHVDSAFAIAVGRIARTPVTFAIQPSPGASPAPASSGVDDWVAQAIGAQLPAVLAPAPAHALTLASGLHRSAAWVTPLDTQGGRAALVALAANPAGRSIPDGAQPLLLGVATFTGLGLLVVLLLWRRTWLPLQEMLELIRRAAQTGDQHLTARVSGSPIVRDLRDSINPLLLRPLSKQQRES